MRNGTLLTDDINQDYSKCTTQDTGLQSEVLEFYVIAVIDSVDLGQRNIKGNIACADGSEYAALR